MGTNRHAHGRIHAKRGAALLIALLMLMMTVPLSLTAFAAEEGGFEYELINNDSEVKITGYTGESTNVTIPSTLGSKPVTEIGDMAFYLCESLTSITFSSGVKKIGFAAFAASGLTSIVIPDSVVELGDNVFANCSLLTSAIVGNGVTTLNGTFVGCEALTNVTIGSGVKSMNGTFNQCSSLKEIVIPEGVETFGFHWDIGSDSEGADPYGVFDMCYSLKKITLPDSLTEIKPPYEDDERNALTGIGGDTDLFIFTIVCSKDSYAHKFAVEHDYPYEFKTASAPGGINVTTNEGVHFKADEGVFPAGTTFKSEKVTSGAKYEVAEKAKNIQKFVAYDITASSNNAAVQPNGTVNITFAVPEDFDLSKTVIYYISDDGKLELVKSSVDTKARTITAALTHFSTYAVAETATANGTSGTGSPQTGDSNMVVLWAAIMLISAAAIVFITVKHRKSVKD